LLLLGGLALATTSAMAEQVSREQDIVNLRLGQHILVDDGSCPAEQIKEVSGAKMTASGILRAQKCIPLRRQQPGGEHPAANIGQECPEKPGDIRLVQRPPHNSPATSRKREAVATAIVVVTHTGDWWTAYQRNNTARYGAYSAVLA
jgi:hypothetical protein